MYDLDRFKVTSQEKVLGITCIILGYIGIVYFSKLGQNWQDNVVSVPTFIIEIAKILIFAFSIFYGSIAAIYIIKELVKRIPDAWEASKELPQKINYEVRLLRNIWENRGIGKYRLFGGIGFYIRLRMRVFAFIFALVFFVSTSYFLYSKYRDFQPTHWVEKVYHNSKVRTFVFKKDIPYTISLHGAEVDYIFVNGYYFCGQGSNVIPNAYTITLKQFRPNDIFNIKFPEETHFAIKLRTEMVVNDIVSEKYEIWENKEEGQKYHYKFFDYRSYLDNSSNKQNQDNSKQNKKK